MLPIHSVPSLKEAEQMMDEAGARNPGPWVQHSRFVAQAAEAIAARHPALDPQAAYVLGYLHDIGRRAGVTDLRHTLDGYRFLLDRGFATAARVCLTHSFPSKNLFTGTGKWDCTPQELETIQAFIEGVEYDDYDRLLQLCDALALPTGFCLIEKRLVDVALRRGVSNAAVENWKLVLGIQRDFEQVIGTSLYRLLPGVVENTFGFDPTR